MNDEDTWPTPNYMGKESGRPGELTLKEVFAINDGVKACTGRGQDAIKDVQESFQSYIRSSQSKPAIYELSQ
jgi:hypothetical protein